MQKEKKTNNKQPFSLSVGKVQSQHYPFTLCLMDLKKAKNWFNAVLRHLV